MVSMEALMAIVLWGVAGCAILLVSAAVEALRDR
jgi:hypothetical protein